MSSHPSPNHSQSHQPTHEEIALCAYLIWVREGYPEGRDKEHWYEAETQLHVTRAHDGWLGDADHAAGHTLSE